MEKKSIHLLLALACVALVSGCSTIFNPDAQRAKLTEVTEVPSGATFSLVNAQPSMEKMEISQRGVGRTIYAIPHEWTDSAIASLTETLKKKGVVVRPNAPKSLKIAVTKPTLSLAGGGLCVSLHHRVHGRHRGRAAIHAWRGGYQLEMAQCLRGRHEKAGCCDA